MPKEKEENDIKIYPDVPAEFPGPELERDTETEAIVESQNKDDANLETAEAEKIAI